MTSVRNLANNREQTRHEQLQKRMLDFAVSVVRQLDKEKTLSPRTADQLVRSSTSIGANYAEACNTVSKSDSRNKIFIAKKEAAETRYWIDLCIELTGSEEWSGIRQEAHELLVILQSVVNTLRKESAK